MKLEVFGRTATNLPILSYRFEACGPEVLVLGGVHGDEPEGVAAAKGVLENCISTFNLKLNLTIVPIFNLDGVLSANRLNGNGVDLNRNLPTKDWDPTAHKERYNPGISPNSETENQALVNFVKRYHPKRIISLHSWKPLINVNGNCREEAQAISSITGYEIVEDIGYPTPGSLGTYCGIENSIPTITYEIERGLPNEKVIQNHVPAVVEAFRVIERIRP